MALQFIITTAGRAAMVNPAGGTKAVQIASVGVSPTAVVADPAITALPGEVKRITTIAGDAVATDMVHLIVRDESDATYSVRSFALYLADGTLFGIYGQAAVILEKSAGAVFLLAVDLALVNVPAANITFGATNFLNPPATTDRAGVVELATDAEAAALVDALRALTPKNMAAIFTAANILSRLLQVDGAGSGLDADLLDGQQGAYYTDIVGRLGYTPLNTTSYTASDIRAKLITVDGAGSGVDADLLDGREGAYYADIVGRLGYTPINPAPAANTDQWFINGRFRFSSYGSTGGQNGAIPSSLVVTSTSAADTGAVMTFHRSGAYAINMGLDDDNIFRIGGSSAPGGLFALDTGGGLYLAGSRVWTAGNDGAGSGLDADLLDGRDSAWYADIITRLGFSPVNPAPAADVVQALRNGFFRFISNRDTTDSNYQRGTTLQVASDDSTGATMSFHRLGSFAINAGLDRDNIFRIGGFSAPTSLFALNMQGGLFLLGNPAWTAGNDGAGSGLDADLLDGRQAAEFALLTGATFSGSLVAPSISTPARGIGQLVMVAGDTSASGYLAFLRSDGTREGYIGYAAGGGAIPLRSGSGAGWDFQNGPVTRDGARIWDAANDGAGSGLDADLLDGHQGAEFALLTGATFSGPVGRDANFYMGTFGSLAQLVMGDGAQINFDRQNRIFNISVDNKNPLLISAAAVVVGEGLSLSRANAGRYVHYGDGSIKGDTITRGVGAPTGGTDGDQYLQINTGAGTMTVWHNYGGTWVHT